MFTFTVLEDDKHGVWHYDNKKFYFWYKAQHVLSTQGNSSGILLHGEFEAFYENKQLARKGKFIKGLKNGQWLYWRHNGTLLKIEHWSNGKQRGIQTFHDKHGNEVESIFIHVRKTHRHANDSLIVTRTRNREEITTYDSIGRIKRIEQRKNGALHGVVHTYLDGKRVNSQRFKNGTEIIKKKASDEGIEASTEEEESKLKAWWSNLFKKKEKPEETDEEPKPTKSSKRGEKEQ
jgi:antitoxin component YwqK of YwqJK toxin-antitoxin module